jgi:glycosyltransferase involved in cell wall biosynthesis
MNVQNEMDLPQPQVALLLHSLKIGGAERVALDLLNHLVSLGYRVDLVLVQAKGDLLAQVSKGARVINLGAKNAYLAIPAFVRYLRNEKPEVILSPFELVSWIVLLARRIFKFPSRIIVRISSTISQHRQSAVKRALERILISRLYPWADGIVLVSKKAAEDFTTYTGISSDCVRVIYNPVITKQFLEDSDKNVDHPFFQPGQPPVVLGVGRLSEPKDFPVLIKAFALVKQRMPARLLILGDGELRSKLEKLIISLGIRADTDLPGFVMDPAAYMRRASVFVLSSRWEGLPGVLIQALACGCPIVSTDCPSGPAEILDDGKYGHLVPVGDVEGLAQAIEKVLKGDRFDVPRTWLDQFKIESIIRQYLDVMGLGG